MNESTEFIGTMRSTPQPEPQAPAAPKPRSNGTAMAIGFLLWAICLLIFPTYARLDDLSAGIFYGMGCTLLLITGIGLMSIFSQRTRKTGSAATSKTTPTLDTLNRRQRSVTIGIGIGILLLLAGVILLVFPTEIQIGSASINVRGASLLLVMLGISFLYVYRMQRAQNRRMLATIEAQARIGVAPSAPRSNGFASSVFLLLFGLCFLIFPQSTSMSALTNGFLYGIGFMFFLMGIIALSSSISRWMANRASAQ